MCSLPFAFSLSPSLQSSWLRLALLVLGAALLLAAYLRRTSPPVAYLLGAPGAVLALLGAGGLVVPWNDGAFFGSVAGLLLMAALGVLVVMAALLFISGAWSRPLAYAVPAVALFALGGVLLGGVEYHAGNLGNSLTSVRLASPFWLILVPVVWPLVILIGYRRLTRHEFRPWLSMGLRLAGVTLLLLALPDPFFDQTSRGMTVLFVLDRSQSVPEDVEIANVNGVEQRTDRRAPRILAFLNDCVQKRGADHKRDRAGLIVFGRRPRLDLPPSDAPVFNLTSLPSADDPTYTDIGASLKLAMASFPEGSSKRIVLISDGNENLGNAEEQARLAQTLGIQIDVLTLGGGKRNEEEILVERVEAPPVIEQGADVPIRVLVRSHNPNVVVGVLILRQITEKEGVYPIRLGKDRELGVEVVPVKGGKGVTITEVVPDSPAGRAPLEPEDEIHAVNDVPVNSADDLRREVKKADGVARLTMHRRPIREVRRREVRLIKGLNVETFRRPVSDEQRSYTYEAEFRPIGVEDKKGNKIQDKIPGDRVENNRASTHVVARGQRRILLLEKVAGQHQDLVDKLVEGDKGRSRFKVVAEPVAHLKNYPDRAQLAVYLSNFDCVILANVPAEEIPEEQQEVIRANTHDQGCGLIMIGGMESFGAGGWQNTPVEKALPVDCDVKQKKVQSKGALVLCMHACEMAQGNFWEKKIAKLAVERLGPADEVGILDFGFNVKWAVPMQEVGPNRPKIMGLIDTMSPGDMPDFDPMLKMAHDALMDKKKEFGAKHIIVISDGDPQLNKPGMLKAMKADKITVSTIIIAGHGTPQDQQKMSDMAKITGGRAYSVDDPKKLPAIYIKETRLVSQSFIHKGAFQPILMIPGAPPMEGIPAGNDRRMLPLTGFVRTSAKEDRLVEVPIVTPRLPDDDFPILAHWTYGLGKGVAFTSDAGLPELWCRTWKEGVGGNKGIFDKFWEQVVTFALRPDERNSRLEMFTDQRDGKIKIVVKAKDQDGKPDTNLDLKGGVTTPGKGGEQGKKQELRFRQTNSGEYEATVPAEEAGSYFVTAQAMKKEQIRDKNGNLLREVTKPVDSVRGGVTIPYSPEFFDLESNAALMDVLREITGGETYVEDDELLQNVAASGKVFRPTEKPSRTLLPFHYWLLFLAAGLLLLDVAVRRLAFDAEAAQEQAKYVWSRLRGIPVPPPDRSTPMLRLRARGDAVVSGGDRASRRFEGGPVTTPDVAGPAQPRAPRPPAAGTRPPDVPAGAEPPPQAANLEDLLEVKKRLWKKDRGKEKE